MSDAELCTAMEALRMMLLRRGLGEDAMLQIQPYGVTLIDGEGNVLADNTSDDQVIAELRKEVGP